MRLKEIKLAGFKSFVDPTTVALPGNRSAVVGPNGCGKSNVIDAVRWVMGESSARQLRGEALTDVIFNGSGGRSPTALASVELVFDNRAGRVGGSLVEGRLANYAEIAVRREVSRDAQSTYYLNGSRCRRRDIADVFLGTGFGPRSYSIVEQGMISELADAKPEELRGYLEEAAGVTKYKERRRETQNRIAHTKENLERHADLREELDRQLAHLKRQARAAERYRELKREERTRTAQLHAIRLATVEAALREQTAAATALEVEHAGALSERQTLDTALERHRAAYAERSDGANAAQARLFEVRVGVQALEQAMEFARKRRAELEREQQALAERQRELAAQLEADGERVEATRDQLEAKRPALAASEASDATAAERLEHLEQLARSRRREWEEHSRRANENTGEERVCKSRLEHGEEVLADLRDRLAKLPEERAAAEDAELVVLGRAIGQAVRHMGACGKAMEDNAELLAAAKESLAEREAALEDARRQAQQRQAEHTTLAAAQEAALDRATESDTARQWLEGCGLRDAPRLAENLIVAPGWERAVEIVLRDDMQAVVARDGTGTELPERMAALAAKQDTGRVAVLQPRATTTDTNGNGQLTPLASFAQGDYGSLLAGVYAADSPAQALAARQHLTGRESVVTREGLWLGVDWVRLDRGADEDSVLRRAAALEALRRDVEAALGAADEVAARAEECRSRIGRLEQQREALRARHADAAAELARVKNEHDVRRVRQEEAQAHVRRAAAERRDLQDRINADGKQLEAVRVRLTALAADAETLAVTAEALRAAREEGDQAVDAARREARQAHDEYHRRSTEAQMLAASLAAAEAARERMLEEREKLTRRAKELNEAVAELDAAAPDRRQQLQTKLAEAQAAEKELAELRAAVEEIDTAMRVTIGKRNEAEQLAEEVRTRLEDARVERERLAANRDHLRGQLADTGIDIAEARAGVAAATEEGAPPVAERWVEMVEKLAGRIARLGPINLAAIDEYETQAERKRHMDQQQEDLEKALATLQGAIGRIDRVTRARFKDTFNQVNKRLLALFPKFFGGGRASLQLTGEDWLSTGVTLMAQPPGKRPSSIHLLSGGEKAMTAVALIFSIFQINPSPVCMLDEVDAPLDDTNVGRFADLIRELSNDVQFVLITHNKQTMEMADHLLGVTMQEPGVSRLVSVDVEQAARMAVAGESG